MPLDLQEIKSRLSLITLLTNDGHTLRRVGSGWFVPCPFHTEKSPSCKVEEQRYKCFGCGAGGDVFDYWENSRGVDRKTAFDQLATLAGVSPGSPDFARPLPRPRSAPAPQAIIHPFTAEQSAAWLACADSLKNDPAEIQRIATWRGIDPAVILWAADRAIIGRKRYFGESREAFLVEMPQSPSGPLLPVAAHIRLAPHTRGNPREKASWHYDPKGCGGWPLIIGDLSTASYIWLMEGQWDALALISVMGWHRAAQWPTGLAIAAMRGSTSYRKLLASYHLHEKATCFAIADADAAGSRWFEPDGFIHQLSPKVRTTFAFWPGIPGADFNDLVIAGLTREHITSLIRPKVRSPRHAAPTGPTYLAWCKNRSAAQDSLGRAARFVLADTTRPKGRARHGTWKRHWAKLALPPDLLAALHTSWETYKSECTAPA